MTAPTAMTKADIEPTKGQGLSGDQVVVVMFGVGLGH